MSRLAFQVPASAIVVIGLAIAGSAALSGCYEYRTVVSDVPPASTRHRNVWPLAWGLVKGGEAVVDSSTCPTRRLQGVTVRQSLGFTLITFATVGLVAPKRVEWSCAPAKVSEGTLAPAAFE